MYNNNKKMSFEIYVDDENRLDDSWINEFEKNDKPYNEFYKENVFTVNINILYINKDNDIEKELILLVGSFIPKSAESASKGFTGWSLETATNNVPVSTR